MVLKGCNKYCATVLQLMMLRWLGQQGCDVTALRCYGVEGL